MKEEKDKREETITKIRKEIKSNIPEYYEKTKLIEIKNTKKKYIFFGLSFLFMIICTVLSFYSKNIVLIIIDVILCVIVSIVLLAWIILSLFIFGDLEKLRNKIVMNTSEYIKVHFFRSEKRISNKIVIPNQNGKDFSYTNGDYIIDESCVKIDDDGIPNLWYIYGIANPLDFDTIKYLDIYFKNIREGFPEKNKILKLDVRYSAENLRLMKNDKIMNEMHRDTRADINRLIGVIVLIVIIFAIIIFLMLIFLNKTPQVTIIQNVTGVR